MQFSLKSIIFAVVLVAAICSLYFAVPPPLIQTFLFAGIILLATLLVGFIVYDRGYARAFGIGASTSMGLFYFLAQSLGIINTYSYGLPDYLAPYIMVIVALGGCVCMLVYWATLADQPEPAANKRPSRMGQLVSGLVLGLLIGGIIGITGTEYGLTRSSQPSLASPSISPFYAPTMVPTFPQPYPVFPTPTLTLPAQQPSSLSPAPAQ